MDRALVLKAIADETRMKILTLLLQYGYCVRALARKLNLTEATVSQHLKVLKEADLLTGEKRGYFMHYDVRRDVLEELAGEIEALAKIRRESCDPEQGNCKSPRSGCHGERKPGGCTEEVKLFCHGPRNTAEQPRPNDA